MLRYHIDFVGNCSIQGWAFDDSGQRVTVDAWLGGRKSVTATPCYRPDVSASQAGAPSDAGFMVSGLPCGTDLVTDVELHFRPSDIVVTLPLLRTDYARYLRAVWSHCLFVRDYFPRENPTSISPFDALCTPNTPEEMIAIANHLFILKASGVAGNFAEFGCFKGFSTSMLSYACRLLGLRMHVFDSFEGLPPSNSDVYRAGEFKGTIDEVRHNVEHFGAIDSVTFHKGYFADTLSYDTCPPLNCLWMDVDLDSSARDVMTAFPSLDQRGAVFSHECDLSNFANEASHEPLPNTIIAAISATYQGIGAKMEGRHVSGYTGAFWRRGGVEVMPMERLLVLLGLRPLATEIHAGDTTILDNVREFLLRIRPQ